MRPCDFLLVPTFWLAIQAHLTLPPFCRVIPFSHYYPFQHPLIRLMVLVRAFTQWPHHIDEQGTQLVPQNPKRGEDARTRIQHRLLQRWITGASIENAGTFAKLIARVEEGARDFGEGFAD